MTDILGYIVLTLQKDGSWRDDWDGEVHVQEDRALKELAEARRVLGITCAILGVVMPFGAFSAT